MLRLAGVDKSYVTGRNRLHVLKSVDLDIDAGEMVSIMGASGSGKSDVLIRANYSANADIVLERRDQVLSVKEARLQFEGDNVFVEVESTPQHFERRKVKTGLSDGVTIEVVLGLTKDDKIKASVHQATPPAAP